jgi:hypothetical protein
MCGNPPEPGHWLEEAFKPTDEKLQPWGGVVQASTYENLLLTDDYIKGKLETMYPPGSFRHKRMMLGMFGIPAEGAIYDNFDRARHVVSPDDVPWDDVDFYVGGIDLGCGGPTGDPFVFMTAMVTKTGHIYFFGEYYSRDGKTLAQHSIAIRARYRGGIIAQDWGARETLELKALGIRTVPAHKDIVMGIQAVRTRLENGTIHFVRGACPNLMREMPFYSWTEGDGQVAKQGDHALDTMRYICAVLDLPRNRS